MSDIAPGGVATGIILPPPDIRDRVEKTAPFVARNGINFEDRLREKEKHNPQFCFLNPFDPYYKYYAHRLAECRTGATASIKVAKSAASTAATPAPVKKEQKSDKPADYKFSAPIPAISALDLDILKLTAQFVAKNGRQFITTLSQREARNFQFDFLRTNHSLYPFFNTLVAEYSSIITPPSNLLSTLSVSRDDILERCQARANYEREQVAAAEKAKEEAEAERIAFAQIDWFDFVVVETIEFIDADEFVDLPPAVDVDTLKSATLEQKKLMSMMEQPLSALPPPASYTAPAAAEEQLKIRTSYIPSQKPSSAMLSICPICSQPIPAAELEQHMKIELLDPKWKEQKEQADKKKSSTNLYVQDVAGNIKRLASNRSDIFEAPDNAKRLRKDLPNNIKEAGPQKR